MEAINNLGETNVMTNEEAESIGNGFSTKYFDALMGKPNPMALRQMFNEQSVYIFTQHGHPDHEMYGMYLIGSFIKRMEYSKCTVTVRSVATINRPHPTEFTVVSVCELKRPGYDTTFKFTQTFIIKRVPWTATEFRIVETHSKFKDDIEEDYLPKAVSVNMTCRKISLKKAEGFDHIRLPDDDTRVNEQQQPSLKRIENVINTKTWFEKKIGEKPQIKSKYGREKLQKTGEKSTDCSNTSNTKNVRKSIKGKMENTMRVYDASRTFDSRVKSICGNAIVPKNTMVAENPLAEKDSVKNKLKGNIY
jgi:hypothetical protein